MTQYSSNFLKEKNIGCVTAFRKLLSRLTAENIEDCFLFNWYEALQLYFFEKIIIELGTFLGTMNCMQSKQLLFCT